MSEVVDNVVQANPHLQTVEAELLRLDRYELAVLEWRLKWARQARRKQLPPPGSWNNWGIMSGRGFGKTLTGSNWVGIEAAMDPGSFSGLIGPTGDDVREVMIEGPTGIMAVMPEILIDDYNVTLHKLTLWNGSVIRGFSAEEPKRLRGPQHHRVWCDEIAAWTLAKEAWDMMKMGLRLGVNPRVLWTSTPKPVEIIKMLLKMKNSVIIGGSTYENKENLAPTFFDEIRQYEGTRLGRQELMGELINAEEGGIIARSDWRMWPTNKPLPKFLFIVMSLDTAFTEKTINRKTHDPDPTACQVWGIFPNEGMLEVMLLDAWQDYLGFPELVARVKKERSYVYGDADEPLVKTYLGKQGGNGGQGRPPDLIILEDKGSGISLRQQLASEDIFVHPYNPKRMDKTARLHAVSPLFPNKRVWAMESTKRAGEFMSWADDVISQVCSFKGNGSITHDDHVDCCSQALLYLKDHFMGQYETLRYSPREDVDNRPHEHFQNPYLV